MVRYLADRTFQLRVRQDEHLDVVAHAVLDDARAAGVLGREGAEVVEAAAGPPELAGLQNFGGLRSSFAH